MGAAGQGKMTTHSQKKLDDTDLIEFRNRFNLPLTDAQATGLAFYKPAEDSPEMQYLRRHRQQLGGYLPGARRVRCAARARHQLRPVCAAGRWQGNEHHHGLCAHAGHAAEGRGARPRIVPIVADEARTFGMANLFKQVGIYSSVGQRYAPGRHRLGAELPRGAGRQILEEGISEAGAIASWTAAATSYSVHGLAMLPFYIYYSMFGFQRVGDAIWAAADQRARGFFAGRHLGPHHAGRRGLAAPGRHQPSGGSHHPQLQGVRPGLCGRDGRHHRRGHARDGDRAARRFYYVTLMNENYAQPDCPPMAAEGVLRGCYVFRSYQRLMDGRESRFHPNPSPCWALAPS